MEDLDTWEDKIKMYCDEPSAVVGVACDIFILTRILVLAQQLNIVGALLHCAFVHNKILSRIEPFLNSPELFHYRNEMGRAVWSEFIWLRTHQ